MKAHQRCEALRKGRAKRREGRMGNGALMWANEVMDIGNTCSFCDFIEPAESIHTKALFRLYYSSITALLRLY